MWACMVVKASSVLIFEASQLTHEIPGPLIKCATATEGFGLGLSMGVWVLVANYSLRNEC